MSQRNPADDIDVIIHDGLEPPPPPPPRPSRRAFRWRPLLLTAAGLAACLGCYLGGAWVEYRQEWPFRVAAGPRTAEPRLVGTAPVLTGAIANPIRPEAAIARAGQLQQCVQAMQARNFSFVEARVVCERTSSAMR